MSDDLDEEIKYLRDRCHKLTNLIAVEREERLAFQTDLVGKSGDNGKFGSIRGALGTIRAVVAGVAMVALGGLGAGATAVYSAGEEKGIEQARLESIERQVGENTAALKTLTIWSEVIRFRLGDKP
jgi:hypothetical protein